MAKVDNDFDIRSLPGEPNQKTALLIAPPIYDTQYWGQWSQPYGLLRIAALLHKYNYKRLDLFDFMETKSGERTHQHRINPNESFIEKDDPCRPIKPHSITKPGDAGILELYRYHFGKTWKEMESWLDDHGYDEKHPPSEIWISVVMTYWWEPARDLIARLRRRFGQKTTIILGDI
jgi:hypothetical protein